MNRSCALLISAVVATAFGGWNAIGLAGGSARLDPRIEPLPGAPAGPFVRRGDRAVLAIDGDAAAISADDGRIWRKIDLPRVPGRGAGVLLRTREGIILHAVPGAPEAGRGALSVERSLDEGETWETPRRLPEGACGIVGSMIQTRGGRVVLLCRERGVPMVCVSDDAGATWRLGRPIGDGEAGANGPGGGTVVELRDGRLWMLFCGVDGETLETRSTDGGLTWERARRARVAGGIAADALVRLHAGRLALLGGERDPGETDAARLILALSEDDGASWATRATVGGGARGCARLYEHVPGDLWITADPGGARVRVRECALLPWRLSDRTYRVRHVGKAAIRLDGSLDDEAWAGANAETGFAFPWKRDPAPATEFRALCDRDFLYIAFRIEDADIVVLERFGEEADAVLEDRGEIYLSRDDAMGEYHCMEIDSRGRAFDYRGSFYRRLDRAWDFAGLESAGGAWERGYIVEARIPLASLEAAGYPRLRPGARMRWGLFRAEFSHDRGGARASARASIHNLGRRGEGPPPVEEWISWVDPGTVDADFHVPMSLGWLEVVE